VALMARGEPHPAIVRSFTRPPEWRMNPATGEWVIVAPERSARPMMPPEEPGPDQPPDYCPFCEGHEAETPPELLAVRTPGSTPNGPGWLVRAIPNSFPAVRSSGAAEPVSDGFYYRSNGVGRHELFIESAHHEKNLARLPVEQVQRVVQVWLARLREASRDPFLYYAQLFKNHGGDAGASVEHAHSQMIATPMIPIRMREELRYAAEYHQKHRRCVYCELLARELQAGERLVADVPGFQAFVAFAGRQPYESWILPTTHGCRMDRISAPEADQLGTLLSIVLRKMDTALGGPSYNLVFHSAPFHEAPSPSYHWHVEVLPRMTQLAGYEWGSGAHINPVRPEDAAEVLRDERA